MKKKDQIRQNNGQFTIVTGACGGLGGAFCAKLAQTGENLILTGTNSDRLNAKREELAKDYPEL